MVNKAFAPEAMTIDRLDGRDEVCKRKEKKSFAEETNAEIQSNRSLCIVSPLVRATLGHSCPVDEPVLPYGLLPAIDQLDDP